MFDLISVFVFTTSGMVEVCHSTFTITRWIDTTADVSRFNFNTGTSTEQTSIFLFVQPTIAY